MTKRRCLAISDARLLGLLGLFRVTNGLACQTFFQPDEYFQALEPAHRLVYGYGYVTWEWRTSSGPIRSPLVPLLFAMPYWLLKMTSMDATDALIWLPKVCQGLVAAWVDYATFKLARKMGADPWTALFCSVISLFNAFVTIRTFSNSIETALTVTALYLWPWKVATLDFKSFGISLLFSAISCMIRPSNALIWLWLGGKLLLSCPTMQLSRVLTLTSSVFALALTATTMIDHLYFGGWPLTLVQFLRHNVLEGISTFYGSMAWHFYFVQALPVLTWSLLPFVLSAFWSATLPEPLKQLRSCIVFVFVAFSFLQHKEIRFAQPLLPALHLLAAQSLSKKTSKSLRVALLAVSAIPAIYMLRFHARGQIAVMQHLRSAPVQSVAFIMPCHSTPWQSHLHRPDLEAAGLGDAGEGGLLWALSCEPPILGQNKSTYLDQSDVFYRDPMGYFETRFPKEVDPEFPPSPAIFPSTNARTPWRHTWPSHLVLFDALLQQHAGAVARLLQDKGYSEEWRTWNSHWHDDARRTGDVIVLRHRSATTGQNV